MKRLLVTLLLTTCSARAQFVVNIGCDDPKQIAALQGSGSFIVHALDTEPAKVRAARDYFVSQGINGNVSAALFNGRDLPYVDSLVNSVVVSDPAFHLPPSEIDRVLAPGGVAVIGGKKTVKPWPNELDEWPHYLYSSENNAVSRDSAITAPIRHLQWNAGPRYARHHDKSSSIPAVVSSGGRVFYIADDGPRASILWDPNWKVVARDAFNGVRLWERAISRWTDQLWGLKSGPANAPRRLVANSDAVYVTLGLHSPVSKLDATTGRDVRVYGGTEKTEELIFCDGVLYLVVSPAIDPARRGGVWERAPKTVMAVKESDGAVLWQKELPWIAPLSLTVADRNLYLCDGPRIIAFDRKSGKELWTSQELPWREKMPTYFGPTLVAVGDDCLLYAGGENWREHAGSMGLMTCLEAGTGAIRWQNPHLPSGYQSPQDIFVIGGTAWCGSLNSKPGEFDRRYPEVAPSTGEFVGYDIKTGGLSESIPRGADCYWFHHRCYRARATENYFLTSRTGIEMIDIKSGKWDLHHWVRGACLYGIMPANGLVYAPPHPCACYPEAKLSGFNALAGGGAAPVPEPGERLLKGEAYTEVSDLRFQISQVDWPTFRGNPARSGSTPLAVDAKDLEKRWETKLASTLSQPVIGDGKLVVAEIDAHAVHALDSSTGKELWSYTAGGRVDSPPTLYRGLVIFGSRDGYVYCLRASDGALVWRFLAAPADRRIMSYDQLESVWPVHGSVLIRNDVAYVVAGRSMFLDGGLTLYRVNPLTGDVLSRVKMGNRDPNTAEDLHTHVRLLDMPVASPDILSTEGDYIFMRSQPLDPAGNRAQVHQRALHDQRGDDAHLFVPNGFLDDNYWHRAFWVYGRSVRGGPGYSGTGHATPSGKIMVLDDKKVYIFGREQRYWRWTTPTEYRLFCVDRSLPKPKLAPQAKGRRRPRGQFATDWSVEMPILARAMVKAGDTIFACGPEDIVPEEKFLNRAPDQLNTLREQAAIYSGREGSILCAVSAVDGTNCSQTRLDVLPVFDGMIAAGGSIYMSTVDNKVVRLGSR